MFSENDCIEESLIFGSAHRPIKKDSVYFELSATMCHIVKKTPNGDAHGTGFLFKVSEDSYGLFTNNHVLSGYEDFHLKIQTLDINQSVTAKNIRWIFTDPVIDVSYFCLDIDKLVKLKRATFLDEWVNPIDINTECAVIQFPSIILDDKNVSMKNVDWSAHEASGKVTHYSGHFIVHEVSTEHGSSGGAIVVLNTPKVFGIHKGGNEGLQKNFGTIIRDVIEMICWEEKKRMFYSSDFLQANMPLAVQSLQSAVCEIQFSSLQPEQISGFLCILKYKEYYLKGIFTTHLGNIFKREFEAHFSAGHTKLCVKEKDIAMVFANKTPLSFVFIVFTEVFIKEKLNKLTFLSASSREPIHSSDIIPLATSDTFYGKVNEINGVHFFIRDVRPCLPGSPILNEDKEVIGIVESYENPKHTATRMAEIRKFILKKRYFERPEKEIQSNIGEAAVCKVTDFHEGQVKATSTGCLVTFHDESNTKYHGLFKFARSTNQTFEIYFEACKTTFQISPKNAKFFNIGKLNWAFVSFNEQLFQELSANGLIFLEINRDELVVSSPIVVRYHQNGREVTTKNGVIIDYNSNEILHDAYTVSGSVGAPLINEDSQVVAIHNGEPPKENTTGVHGKRGMIYARGIPICLLYEKFLDSIKTQSDIHVVKSNTPYFNLAPAICHISVDNYTRGTGFLFKLSKFYGLFTCDFVLKGLTSFQLNIPVKGITRDVTPGDIDWIFTDPDLNATFLVLNEKILSELRGIIFLEMCDNDVDIGEDIVVLQYPYLSENMIKQLAVDSLSNCTHGHLCAAPGEMLKYSTQFIFYAAITAPGSAGGPVIEPNTRKVIGMHIGRHIDEDRQKRGVRLQDVIQMIYWEVNRRNIYSTRLLRKGEKIPLYSPRASVCEISYLSNNYTNIAVGFLCSMKDEDSYLHGIFTTCQLHNVKEEFHIRFYGNSDVVCVKNEDIALRFTHKMKHFTFMAFVEHFIEKVILNHKLTFLSATAREPDYGSNVVIPSEATSDNRGFISEMDFESIFIRKVSPCPIGSPVLNNENEVIAIVKENETDRVDAENIQSIMKFIFKRRYFVPEFSPPPEKKFRTDGSPAE